MLSINGSILIAITGTNMKCQIGQILNYVCSLLSLPEGGSDCDFSVILEYKWKPLVNQKSLATSSHVLPTYS